MKVFPEFLYYSIVYYPFTKMYNILFGLIIRTNICDSIVKFDKTLVPLIKVTCTGIVSFLQSS